MAAVTVVALLLAACGSGSGDEQADVEALKTCIEDNFDPDWMQQPPEIGEADIVAEGAGVGSFNVTTENQEANFAAERTSDDAEDTAAQYESFGMGAVEQYGTVVVAYNNTPTDEESSAVENCLSDQGIS